MNKRINGHSTTQHPAALLAFFAFLSWLGMMIHNAQELPQLTLLSPEEFYPTLVYVALLAAYAFLPWKRAVLALFLGWALLHLIGGGILSVIPFSFLPFYPEQTIQHYLAHAIYSIAQLPLIVFAWRHVFSNTVRAEGENW